MSLYSLHLSDSESVKNYKTPVRILVGVFAPLAVTAGLIYLYLRGSPFFCLFHELTGLHCFGCGSGRAAYALLHFRFLEAVHNNVLFVVFAPLCGYYFTGLYLRIVFNARSLKLLKINKTWAMVICCAFIAFIVLRNIPITPFTYLAPID